MFPIAMRQLAETAQMPGLQAKPEALGCRDEINSGADQSQSENCTGFCRSFCHQASLRLGFEGDAHRVDAITIARGGLWRIIEHVPQVTAALGATNLSANHAVCSVL